MIGMLPLLTQLQIKPRILKTSKNAPAKLSKNDQNLVIISMKNIAQPLENSSGESWLTYGNQLYRTRQFDKAVSAFDKAISKGQLLTGNYGKALALWMSDRLKESEITIAKAISLIPKNEYASYYYFWKFQGEVLLAQDKYSKSIKAIDIAIRLEPNDSILLTRKAIVLTSSKQYVEAISLSNIIIKKNPGYYAYANRGSAKIYLKDYKGALADYSQAIEFSPGNTDGYSMRGISKDRLGDYEGAISDFSQVIKIDYNNYLAYGSRAGAKQSIGDYKEAILDLDRAIKINPKYLNAYNMRRAISFV